jgi:Mn-dependent DtxR family transcriptional regulator
MANFSQSGRRGRPRTISALNRSGIYSSFLIDRLIKPVEALELVKSLTEEFWTYKKLAELMQESRESAMQIMNDLVHYGLMKYIGKGGKSGKVSIFQKIESKQDVW